LSQTGALQKPTGFWNEKSRSPWFVCLLLAVATLSVYWPVARHDFVNYDDGDYVTGNLHVQSGLNWENVLWAFGTGHASNWHPLTWLSHMLDCQLFGMNPGAQHLVNLGFHIVNTLLCFLLLRHMTGAHGRSAVVAALFALHPLHVESVAWISERKDVLSTLFLLLTLWAYVCFVENRGERRRKKGERREEIASRSRLPSSIFYLLALLCFALGLMSKPMLVTLPFMLLLLDYWPLERFQFGVRSSGFNTLLRLLWEKLPFFALSAASCVVTFLAQRKGGAVSTSLSVAERLANALVSYVRYISKMFWPEKLSVLYPHPGHWPAWVVVGCAALLLALCVGVILLARTRRYLLVGWLWFVGGLVPVIGLIQVGIQSMADRYTYVPLIGLFVMVVWGLSDVLAHWRWRAQALASGASLALAACVLLTSRQIGYWRNSETLFQHAVAATDRNYLAYNNLGFYLSNRGEAAAAMENYRKSLEINPAYEDALNNMGYALAGQKKYTEAIGYYEAALRVRPNHTEVNNNLGNALSELGRLDEAIQHYQIALAQNPEHADAHNNFGIALAMQGKLDEAMVHFRAAIRYKPNYASAHSNLGNALAVQHKLDEAITEYQESLRLKPDEAQAHNNLGNALAEKGRLDEAIAHYQQALRLNADNPEAHYNLATALLRQGKREEALIHYGEAVRLKPDYAQAKEALQREAMKR
jgi:protein O-mannosyl-transferase